jgi:hypothetical protein
VQKVRLIFVGVCGFVQLDAPGALESSGVVSGCKSITAEATNVFKANPELDLSITENIGVGRSAGAILRQKIVENSLPIFCGEIDAVQRDSEFTAYGERVLVIRRNGAIRVVLFPVRHEEALDLEALLTQQQGGDCGVDTPRKSDDDHVFASFAATPR